MLRPIGVLINEFNAAALPFFAGYIYTVYLDHLSW